MPELNLVSKVKKIGSYAIGLAIFAAIILIPVAFLWGAAAVSAFLYPLFSTLAGISILIFIAVILPLSLFNKLRIGLAVASLILSWICGAAVWMYSFLIIIGYLGWFAIFLLFVFQFVSPIAIIGLFIKGSWAAGLSIIAALIFTYGMRFYGFWLEELYNRKKSGFIEIESETISEHHEKDIKKFKKMCILTVISYAVLLIGAAIIGIYLPNLYEKSNIFRIFFLWLIICIMTIWIILLFYLYKVSKILRVSGKLSVRPSLILIFTIVSTYTWYVLSVIPFIIVWVKSSRYLKYEIAKVEVL